MKDMFFSSFAKINSEITKDGIATFVGDKGIMVYVREVGSGGFSFEEVQNIEGVLDSRQISELMDDEINITRFVLVTKYSEEGEFVKNLLVGFDKNTLNDEEFLKKCVEEGLEECKLLLNGE